MVDPARPVTVQPVEAQDLVMQVPPPTGHSVTLAPVHGPPAAGGTTATVALVGLAAAAVTDGDLHAGNTQQAIGLSWRRKQNQAWDNPWRTAHNNQHAGSVPTAGSPMQRATCTHPAAGVVMSTAEDAAEVWPASDVPVAVTRY